MDPILAEAILRTVRTLAFITGALVLVDSIGILLRGDECPPHKPGWSAAAWTVMALTFTCATVYLLSEHNGLVDNSDPIARQAAVWFIYSGAAASFTIRAISRAHRPLYTILAVLGLSIAGVIFALKDIAG